MDVDTQTGLEEMLETSGGGLARLSSLASNEVFISERLEKSLDLQVGEMVTLFVENTPYEFRVAEIVKDNGLTSKDQAGPGSKPGVGVNKTSMLVAVIVLGTISIFPPTKFDVVHVSVSPSPSEAVRVILICSPSSGVISCEYTTGTSFTEDIFIDTVDTLLFIVPSLTT